MLSPSGYSALNDSEDFKLSPATSSPTNENAERDAENELVKDAEDSLQDPQVSLIKHESMLQIALEMLLPFIFAGIGMVLAGLLFDHVQVIMVRFANILYITILSIGKFLAKCMSCSFLFRRC